MIKLIVDKEFMTCTECDEAYPATEECFYKQKYTNKKGTFYKLVNPCKKCRIKRASKHFQDNRDELLPKKQAKYKENKKKYAKKEREWEIKNKDKRRRGLRDWQKNNPQRIKEYNIYREMNKKHKIPTKEWEMCKSYFDNSCAYCGLPSEQHQRMYGDKMKIIDLHRDHVDHKGENDLSNCVPSCQSCNSSKGTKDIKEWYPEHEKYSVERENKINRWLNEDYKIYHNK